MLGDAFGDADVHPAADTEHPVPARPVLLDLRRRHLQPDVLAGAQAGNAAAARRLQVPSAVQGRQTSRSGGATPTSPSRAATLEGGDVMPIGKGVVLIGMGERTTRQAVGQVARRAVPQQGGDARHRLPDAEEPRGDASRHRVHASATAISCTVVPRGRRSDPLLQHRTARRQRRRRGARGQQAAARRRPGGARPEDAARRRQPAATPARPSASSGTTATTSSRSSPASSSATTATPIPTRCCARPGSR